MIGARAAQAALMNAQGRAAWALAVAALAGLGMGLHAPDAAWAACVVAAPATWQGVLQWRSLRPRLPALCLLAGAAAAAGGHAGLAAASLAVAAAAGAGQPLGALPGVAVGLAAAVGILQGQDAGVDVLALACGGCALLQLSEALADGALELAARRGVRVSGRDVLRVAAAIDGVVLAMPGGAAPAARRGCSRRQPVAGPAMRAKARLRGLGCEVWERGGRVVPIRRRVDEHVFAVADMLARGRRVAVVAAPGGLPPAADLAVQSGGGPPPATPGVVLPGDDLGPLVDFLRLARRTWRARASLALMAMALGGPGVAWAALGHLSPGAAAWVSVAAAVLLAAAHSFAGGAPAIFTSSQRRYG